MTRIEEENNLLGGKFETNFYPKHEAVYDQKKSFTNSTTFSVRRQIFWYRNFP